MTWHDHDTTRHAPSGGSWKSLSSASRCSPRIDKAVESMAHVGTDKPVNIGEEGGVVSARDYIETNIDRGIHP